MLGVRVWVGGTAEDGYSLIVLFFSCAFVLFSHVLIPFIQITRA